MGIGEGITTEGQLKIALCRIVDLKRKLKIAWEFADSEHRWAEHYFLEWQKQLDRKARK